MANQSASLYFVALNIIRDHQTPDTQQFIGMALGLDFICSNNYRMPIILPKSIVFITGTFIGNNCWDEWQLYFESKGYKCIAPAWPHKESPPEELRNRPPWDPIASNRLVTVTDYFAMIIDAMPEKPILIGHSLGGLVVQLLLQRGLGMAGVALHSFPPKGVIRSKITLLKTLWEPIGFFTNAQSTYFVPFRKWKQAFANGMSCEEQKSLYYKYAIPESKKVIRDVFKSTAKIDFKGQHPPLLLTSGTCDQLIPALVNYNNYLQYGHATSITEYREFENSNHLVFDHLHEEAEYVFHWLQGIQSISTLNIT